MKMNRTRIKSISSGALFALAVADSLAGYEGDVLFVVDNEFIGESFWDAEVSVEDLIVSSCRERLLSVDVRYTQTDSPERIAGIHCPALFFVVADSSEAEKMKHLNACISGRGCILEII